MAAAKEGQTAEHEHAPASRSAAVRSRARWGPPLGDAEAIAQHDQGHRRARGQRRGREFHVQRPDQRYGAAEREAAQEAADDQIRIRIVPANASSRVRLLKQAGRR